MSAQQFSQPGQSVPIRFRGEVVPVVGRFYGPFPGGDAEAAR